MRKSVSLLLGAWLLLALPASAADLAQTLIAKQQALTAAERRHDKSYITSQLADGFLEINPEGKMYTATEALQNFDNMRIDEAVLSNVKVIELSPTIGIVTFNANIKAIYKGQAVAGRMYVGAIWVKTDADWKLRFAQVTPIPPEKEAKP